MSIFNNLDLWLKYLGWPNEILNEWLACGTQCLSCGTQKLNCQTWFDQLNASNLSFVQLALCMWPTWPKRNNSCLDIKNFCIWTSNLAVSGKKIHMKIKKLLLCNWILIFQGLWCTLWHMHEIALKCIGRYLLGTWQNGLLLYPTGDIFIDRFVDANYAGLWSYEHPNNADCVQSHSRHVFLIGGCLVVWSSKLQTEIALSTMQVEYVALLMAMCILLPFQHLLHEICDSISQLLPR